MLKISKNLRRLLHCESGNIIIFTGIAIFVLVLAVGVAIDMSRTQVFKSRMQSAADAANLAAGTAYIQNNCANASAANPTKTNPPTTSPQDCFMQFSAPKITEYFAANIPADYVGASNLKVTPVLNGSEINLTVNANVPVSFLSILHNSSSAVGITITSQVTVPTGSTSTPIDGQCSNPLAFGSCGLPSNVSEIIAPYTSSAGTFGSWSCNSTKCCLAGTTVDKCPSGQNGTITTTYICSADGTLQTSHVTNACTCANGADVTAAGCAVNSCGAGEYPDANNVCHSCNSTESVATGYTRDGVSYTKISEAGDIVNFWWVAQGSVKYNTPDTLTFAETSGSDTDESATVINGNLYEVMDNLDLPVGRRFDFSCSSITDLGDRDPFSPASFSCFTQPDAQQQILKDYLSVVNTVDGPKDPKALYCPITLVPTVVFDPLKVNIKGGNATLNSTNTLVYEMVSHKTGQKVEYQTQGGLNEHEAWLMVDRDGSGLVHNGVINGEDFFTDHYGQHPNAYHDLARWFHEFIKQDEKGRSYIPLDVADEKVSSKPGHNPYRDLKLLDIHNNVLLAHDYFDRIYVDHINVSENGSDLKTTILQRSFVRDLNGRFHLSADEWFAVPGGTFALPPIKANSINH